ncbi:MAG TPA: hypothetical protein VIE89_14035 [Candidatus Binatia bacterium]|jgi:hypothetical protein
MAEQARTLTSLSAGEDFADPGREIPLDPSSDHYIANPRSTVVWLAQRTRLTRRSVTNQTQPAR